MTSEEYLQAMEEKARLKKEAEKAKELKRKEAELTKQQRMEERKLKEVAKTLEATSRGSYSKNLQQIVVSSGSGKSRG